MQLAHSTRTEIKIGIVTVVVIVLMIMVIASRIVRVVIVTLPRRMSTTSLVNAYMLFLCRPCFHHV